MSPSRRRVLVRVDAPKACVAIEMWLREMGYDPVVAVDDAEVVERFAKGDVACVVFQLDGTHLKVLGTLARLREMPGGKSVATLAVTAARGADLARLRSFAEPLGVRAYLVPPMLPQRFAHAMERLLGASPRVVRSPPVAEQPAPQAATDPLVAEMQRLEQLAPPDRLGLAPGSPPTAVRDRYFELVANYHREAARVRGEEALAATRRIQTLLQEGYLAVRQTTRPAVPAAAATPSPPPASPVPPSRPAPARAPAAARPAPPGLAGEDAESIAGAGLAVELLGDYAFASQLLRRALVEQPGNVEWRYRLMMCLARGAEAQGREEEATKNYQEAASVGAGHVAETRAELQWVLTHHRVPRWEDGALRRTLQEFALKPRRRPSKK